MAEVEGNVDYPFPVILGEFYMQYSKGKVGRVFVLKFDDGDDLISGITGMLKEEGVKSGIVQIIGALRKAEYVTGPKEAVIPPVPVWSALDNNAHEVFAVGTIFPKEGEPSLHMHGSFFLGETVKGGCIRKGVQVFLIVEAVIIEFLGIGGERLFSEETQHYLLDFKDN